MKIHRSLPLLLALLGWSCATLPGPPPIPQEVIDAILAQPCTEYASRDTNPLETVPPDSIPPRPEEITDVPFQPYDFAPRPVGGEEAIQQNIRYPEEARLAGIEGTIVVYAFVDELGCVLETIILWGMSDPALNEAAFNAVKSTRFIPAFYKVQPVAVWVSVPVHFHLDEQE